MFPTLFVLVDCERKRTRSKTQRQKVVAIKSEFEKVFKINL